MVSPAMKPWLLHRCRPDLAPHHITGKCFGKCSTDRQWRMKDFIASTCDFSMLRMSSMGKHPLDLIPLPISTAVTGSCHFFFRLIFAQHAEEKWFAISINSQ